MREGGGINLRQTGFCGDLGRPEARTAANIITGLVLIGLACAGPDFSFSAVLQFNRPDVVAELSTLVVTGVLTEQAC